MSEKSKKRKERIKASQVQKEKLKDPSQSGFWKNSTHLIVVAFALFITFLCFKNTTNNQFVNWDDPNNFYENDHVTTINKDNFWSNSKKIFTSHVIGNYNPLSIWTFALEKRIYGLEKPGKWHGTNVFLHLICVFFVFRICLLLGLRWQGALFVTLMFGIHPMRVESVAWVTERKDVLFGAFYLAALYFYIKGKLIGKGYHLIIFTLFLFSLFSKIQAVILPLSMIAIDYYMSGKLDFKAILKKAPYFLLSLIFGLIGIYFLRSQGSIENAATYPAWQRIFVGSYSYMVYLVKMIFPYEMSPLYPYPRVIPAYFYPTLLLFFATIYGMYMLYKKEMKAWFFGLLFFAVNIIFLLQILGAGQGFLADRFTYIAYFGLFFIAGFYFDKFTQRKDNLKFVFVGGAVVLFSVFASMTVKQNKIWENGGTLWTQVIKHYSNTTLPYGNRANYFRDQGKVQEALRDYSQVILLKPEEKQAFNSRARLYFDIAKTRDTLLLALQDYNRAIELDSENGEFLINRGATHARLGDIDKGIEDINEGLLYDPNNDAGYLNRLILYNSQGKTQEALNDMNSYLELRPYNANVWYEKGRALRSLSRYSESISAYSRAIQLDERRPLFYYERGRTYMVMNKIDEAKRDIQITLSLGYTGVDPALRQQLGI